MKFLCLAYAAESDWKALTKAEQDALLAQDEALRNRGTLMTAVEPAVTTVRAWDGNPSVSSGAYAQSHAPIAGFSVIEAKNIEQVVRLVTVTPCARARGAIEIRPIMFINDAEWKHTAE